MKTILSCVLVIATSVLSCSLCLAEDLPRNTDEFKSLTAEQAAVLVAKHNDIRISLNGLTSIDKDVAQELAKFEGINLLLIGLTSIDEDVAQELAKSKGGNLQLVGLTSIDKDVLKILKSNPKIYLPKKYRDKKD